MNYIVESETVFFLKEIRFGEKICKKKKKKKLVYFYIFMIL